MDDANAARTFSLPETSSIEHPAVETEHALGYLVSPTDPLPEGADFSFTLADGRRFAYRPRKAAGAAGAELQVDPFLQGNQFKPLHESEQTLAALLSIANGRRLETGPESERLFVFLRGNGLIFLENGDTHRFSPGHVGVVPAGEPAHVWSQGPEDVLAVVAQPRGQAVKRRTLAGEIAKRRQTAPSSE